MHIDKSGSWIINTLAFRWMHCNVIYPLQPCILGNSHDLTVIFTRKYTRYFSCLLLLKLTNACSTASQINQVG